MSVTRIFNHLQKSVTTLAAAKPVALPLEGPAARQANQMKAIRNRPDPFASTTYAANNTFRILSLDGGGVRGMLTTVILARIEREFPAFLDKHVDLIAGSSTGGLIGLLLAAGYTAAECAEIYKVWIPRIFQHSSYLRHFPIEFAKYGSQGKSEACDKYFGDRTLSDLQKYVLITAFNLKAAKHGCTSTINGPHWHPELFSNLPRAQGRMDPHSTTLAADTAMRTSAAPTFFPVYQGYVDGAVFASNPSLMAVARVFEHYPHLGRDHVSVLSIGCGGRNFSIETTAKENDWGLRTWGPYLPEMMLQSQSTANDNALSMMLGKLYHRFDVQLDEMIAIDDYKSIHKLIEIAEAADITPVMKFIQERFATDPKAKMAMAATERTTVQPISQQVTSVLQSLRPVVPLAEVKTTEQPRKRTTEGRKRRDAAWSSSLKTQQLLLKNVVAMGSPSSNNSPLGVL